MPVLNSLAASVDVSPTSLKANALIGRTCCTRCGRLPAAADPSRFSGLRSRLNRGAGAVTANVSTTDALGHEIVHGRGFASTIPLTRPEQARKARRPGLPSDCGSRQLFLRLQPVCSALAAIAAARGQGRLIARGCFVKTDASTITALRQAHPAVEQSHIAATCRSGRTAPDLSSADGARTRR